MELILQGGYQVKLKRGKIEVNVPVPVRKFYRILKWIHQKIHIKKKKSISIG
jgi:hypothetical protein